MFNHPRRATFPDTPHSIIYQYQFLRVRRFNFSVPGGFSQIKRPRNKISCWEDSAWTRRQSEKIETVNEKASKLNRTQEYKCCEKQISVQPREEKHSSHAYWAQITWNQAKNYWKDIVESSIDWIQLPEDNWRVKINQWDQKLDEGRRTYSTSYPSMQEFWEFE